MNMVQIDTDIPLPKHRMDGCALPFAELDVGHSFFVAENDPAYYRVRTLASLHKRSNGKTYTCRYVPNGIRVWRIR